MKLSDLLDELRTNILNDRSDRTSGTSDYLWTDETLVRYINEAQRRFAIRGLVIRDATTIEVVNVTLEEGVDTYTLHPSVIAVVSAKVDGKQADLVRVGHSMLSFQNPSTTTWDTSWEDMPTGYPVGYSTDEQLVEDDDGTVSTVSMRFYPAPDSTADGELVKLRVIRKPLDDLTVNNLSAVPEIPLEHHLDMLDWAAYLALRIVDHDAGDIARATGFANTFEANVKAARAVVLKKMFAPPGWGFGRGGWSWGA